MTKNLAAPPRPCFSKLCSIETFAIIRRNNGRGGAAGFLVTVSGMARRDPAEALTNIVDIELSSSILGFRTVAFIDVNMVLCSVVMLGLDMFQSKHVTGPQ